MPNIIDINEQNIDEYFKHKTIGGVYKLTKYIGSAAAISLPKSIYGIDLEIGTFCFNKADSLQHITLYSSAVNERWHCDLSSCTSLVSVKVLEPTTSCFDSDGVLFCLFNGFGFGYEITVPEQYASEELYIPGDVTEIFEIHCGSGLKRVYFPSTLTKTSNRVFTNSTETFFASSPEVVYNVVPDYETCVRMPIHVPGSASFVINYAVNEGMPVYINEDGSQNSGSSSGDDEVMVTSDPTDLFDFSAEDAFGNFELFVELFGEGDLITKLYESIAESLDSYGVLSSDPDENWAAVAVTAIFLSQFASLSTSWYRIPDYSIMDKEKSSSTPILTCYQDMVSKYCKDDMVRECLNDECIYSMRTAGKQPESYSRALLRESRTFSKKDPDAYARLIGVLRAMAFDI